MSAMTYHCKVCGSVVDRHGACLCVYQPTPKSGLGGDYLAELMQFAYDLDPNKADVVIAKTIFAKMIKQARALTPSKPDEPKSAEDKKKLGACPMCFEIMPRPDVPESEWCKCEDDDYERAIKCRCIDTSPELCGACQEFQNPSTSGDPLEGTFDSIKARNERAMMMESDHCLDCQHPYDQCSHCDKPSPSDDDAGEMPVSLLGLEVQKHLRTIESLTAKLAEAEKKLTVVGAEALEHNGKLLNENDRLTQKLSEAERDRAFQTMLNDKLQASNARLTSELAEMKSYGYNERVKEQDALERVKAVMLSGEPAVLALLSILSRLTKVIS